MNGGEWEQFGLAISISFTWISNLHSEDLAGVVYVWCGLLRVLNSWKLYKFCVWYRKQFCLCFYSFLKQRNVKIWWECVHLFILKFSIWKVSVRFVYLSPPCCFLGTHGSHGQFLGAVALVQLAPWLVLNSLDK
jgi:hypothetical protein